MIGAILGDIIGSYYEFMELKQRKVKFFVDGSRFTDDTVMSLAVAKALMECNGNYEKLGEVTAKIMRMFGKLYPTSICGYGLKFDRWLKDEKMGPYNSFGNGSAMRISAVPYVAKDIDEVKKLTKIVTEITHNHPEGIKGAEATAVAEFMALHGYKKDEIRKHIAENYYKMDYDYEDLFYDYVYTESCQESVPQSLYMFFISDSYEDAINKTISIGGDADTMGAITGAVAGAYYGVDEELTKKGLSYLDIYLKKVYSDFMDYVKNLNK